jgi:hypothetical protein
VTKKCHFASTRENAAKAGNPDDEPRRRIVEARHPRRDRLRELLARYGKMYRSRVVPAMIASARIASRKSPGENNMICGQVLENWKSPSEDGLFLP